VPSVKNMVKNFD